MPSSSAETHGPQSVAAEIHRLDLGPRGGIADERSGRSCCTTARTAREPGCFRRSGRSAAMRAAAWKRSRRRGSAIRSARPPRRRWRGWPACRRSGVFHSASATSTGQKVDVVAGAELARHAVHRPRVQHRAALQLQPAFGRSPGPGPRETRATDMEGIGRR